VFARHHESSALLNASVEESFAYLDDFRQLSSHMARPSAMMAGSRMAIETDERDGRAVGSKVRMSGSMLGMRLALEEVVVEREPPLRKAWQTLACAHFHRLRVARESARAPARQAVRQVLCPLVHGAHGRGRRAALR